jgi:hypothetical protein
VRCCMRVCSCVRCAVCADAAGARSGRRCATRRCCSRRWRRTTRRKPPTRELQTKTQPRQLPLRTWTLQPRPCERARPRRTTHLIPTHAHAHAHAHLTPPRRRQWR